MVDLLATPQDLIPCLVAAGFRPWLDGTSDLLLYVGPDAERPSMHGVTTVQTADDSAAWASVRAVDDDVPVDAGLEEWYRLESADPRVTAYLAHADGRAVAACDLFATAGLGRIEAVRTHPRYRRRGFAAAVVRQAVADSLARDHVVTYLVAEPGGDAQRLYHRLGFRTVTPNFICGFIWQP
jgi:predicted GNAT family acetyltransferase